MRRLAGAGVALLALAACSSSGGDGTGDTIAPQSVDESLLSDYYGQTLAWEPCQRGLECATLTVPLDYADPGESGGGDIELPVVRDPADSGDPMGVLLWWAGAAGSSGAANISAASLAVSSGVRDAFDVVGIDARGTGSSDPLVECGDDQSLADYLDLDPTPDDEAELEQVAGAREEFLDGCRASDPLLSALATVNVARDVDVLRDSLGAERLSVLGQSYGTAVAAEYLRSFGDRVDRVVLDGVIDPALTREQLNEQRLAGLEAGLQAFAEACNVQGCFLGSSEDEIRQAVDDVLEAADANPLPTSQGDRVLTESQARDAIMLAMSAPAEEGYVPLEEAMVSATSGDGSALLWMSDIYRDQGEDGTFFSNAMQVREAIECADRGADGSPSDVADVRASYEEVSATFGGYAATRALGCPPLPAGAEAPGPLTTATDEPVLVVGTTTDPLTPIDMAAAVVEQLPSAELLVWETSSHTAYRLGSPCIDRAVDRYLIEGELPAAGTRCSR